MAVGFMFKQLKKMEKQKHRQNRTQKYYLISFKASACISFIWTVSIIICYRAKWLGRYLQAFRIQTACLTSVRMIGSGSENNNEFAYNA